MAGTGDKMKGRAKVAAGAVTGDKNLENEGRVDRLAGELKDQLAAATSTLEDLVGIGGNKATEALRGAQSMLEDLVNKAKS